MVFKNTPNASASTPIPLNASFISPTSRPIHVDIIASPAIG